MGWLKARFGEASTHAGLSMLFMVANIAFPQYGAILTPIAALLGVGAVVVPERVGG